MEGRQKNKIKEEGKKKTKPVMILPTHFHPWPQA